MKSPSTAIGDLPTDAKTPVVFVLQSGADPTQTLINHAKEMQFENKLFYISLGQG